MKTLIFLVSLIFLLATTSCEKDPVTNPLPSNPPDYFLFGHYFGMCGGEQCIEIFKVQGNVLYEDSVDKYPSNRIPYQGKYYRHSDSLFQLVRYLYQQMPSQLWNVKDTTIGMPDAADWGGLYFEISQNGRHRYWLIDKMESNLPEYLRPFSERIEEAVQKLQ